MEVKQLINPIFNSNTYIISNTEADWVWLIDIGDADVVTRSLPKDIYVRGVFITHAHFDHICGINKLIDSFPNCIIYISELGKKGLYSDKLNLSYYHDKSLIFKGNNIKVLFENDEIDIFDNCIIKTLETPGHNLDCLTYTIENYIFTGDSYIPDVDVVTKLKGGNRNVSKKSLQKIMQNIKENTIICPGHGAMKNIK